MKNLASYNAEEQRAVLKHFYPGIKFSQRERHIGDHDMLWLIESLSGVSIVLNIRIKRLAAEVIKAIRVR